MEVIPSDQASPTIETGVRLQENQDRDWLRPGHVTHWNRHCGGSSWSTYYRHIASSQTTEEDVTIISLLHMRKLRPKEEKPLA